MNKTFENYEKKDREEIHISFFSANESTQTLIIRSNVAESGFDPANKKAARQKQMGPEAYEK